MNKAERADMDRLQVELAFRWPTEAEPQPVTREWIKANLIEVQRKDASVFRGRTMFALGWTGNAYSGDISEAWSDGSYHGRNHTGDDASQTGGSMYATKREAALAMRWAMCRDFAKKLRRVDVLIATTRP